MKTCYETDREREKKKNRDCLNGCEDLKADRQNAGESS